MARERIITAQSLPEDQAATPDQPTLRPRTLNDYIGQRELIEKLRISIAAARQRGEAMEHVLLHGPPGLGKTTLAYIIASELNGTVPKITSGPALARPTELVSMLTNMQRGEVLFIDEIHRIPTAVEEYLYPAMEDFCIDVVKAPARTRIPCTWKFSLLRSSEPPRGQACCPGRCVPVLALCIIWRITICLIF